MNNEETLEDARATTGSLNFEAQYQQNPSPADGVVIKRDWLRYYDVPPEEFDLVAVSWDIAASLEENADYTVGTVWGLKGRYFYLLDVMRGRFETPAIRRLIIETHKKFGADQSVVEKAGLGLAVLSEMKQQAEVRPKPYLVKGDKQSRLMAQSTKFERNEVLLPREAPWLASYLSELLSFPNGRHDDQVDSTSQALDYLTPKLPRPVRHPRPERARQRPQGSIGRRG